nr:MAG TPA: hypothetical protein [Caudoviricetes sp.]
MRAVKENKEYFIDDSQKGFYLTQGFDIYGDDGELLEAAPGKTVSYDEYAALQNKLEALEAELQKVQSQGKGKGKNKDEEAVVAEDGGN